MGYGKIIIIGAKRLKLTCRKKRILNKRLKEKLKKLRNVETIQK